MTDVVELIHARALVSACVSGDRIALTFATDAGLVRVIQPYGSFHVVGRSASDSNGNPFPLVKDRNAELVADAAAIDRVKHESCAAPMEDDALNQERALHHSMWAKLEADPQQNVAILCTLSGAKYPRFIDYANRYHGGLRKLRRQGAHRIIGHTAKAEAGLPLTKPNGSL